jgi:D-beta-D-heptose 7-phosphate kinase/D-beta-D-heptose 1-phosphate adenosyltransferase
MTSIKDNLKILVIGDLMIDHYLHGNCNRISPEAPVPVVEVRSESYTLGGAGNVIKNLCALGCKASVISVSGNDETTPILLKHFADLNVDTSGILKDSTRCTTIKTRVLASNHQLIRLDREIVHPLDAVMQRELLSFLEKEVQHNDLVLVSDYNKGLLAPDLLKGIFEICRRESITTIVDPKGLDFSKYQGANIIKPNKKEASQATGIAITDHESLQSACQKIKEITGCDDVIITMSDEGMAYYTGEELSVIPTKAMGVIDITGAGDTVLASLGIAIASGNNLTDACEFANHAAAVVVSKVGSATATMEEIEKKMQE